MAQPETVTGSIGVVSAHFVLRGLFEKLGVTTDVVKRGEAGQAVPLEQAAG